MSLCKELGISNKEMSCMMRVAYPKMSYAAVSLAERSDETGVQFTSAAKKTAYILAGRVKRPVQRLHPARTTIWFTDAQMEFLQTHENIGDYIRGLVDREMKRAATGATNTDDRK